MQPIVLGINTRKGPVFPINESENARSKRATRIIYKPKKEVEPALKEPTKRINILENS